MSNAGLDESEEIQEIDIVEIKKLKVQELRVRLTELGLNAKGNKPELMSRLIEHYQKEADEELGDDLLDEDDLDDSDDGENKPPSAEADTDKVAAKIATDGATQASDDVTTEKETPVSTAVEASTEVAAKKPVSQMSDKERAELRAKKFGDSMEDAKKMARRERFGPVDDGSLTKRAKLSDEDMEKLKARAARFGSSVSPALTVLEDDTKKKERAKKFGVVPVTSMSMEQRKQKRAAKFNS